MISLEKIVATEFGDVNINEVVKKLAEHNLYDFVTKTIGQINAHLSNREEEIKTCGFLNMSAIAASILIKINEYLRYLILNQREQEKKDLEYLLGNITKRILKEIIDAAPANAKHKQLLSIEIALTDTCILYGYNFESLSEFIQIDDIIIEVYAQATKLNNVTDPVIVSDQKVLPGFFCSSLAVENLPSLIDIMIEEEITKEKDKMLQLFKNPKENLAIIFNENKVKDVLQFFAVLKNSKLISHLNCDGFYQVLICHVKNFNEVFLHGKSPQRRIGAVKAVKNWPVNSERIEGLLKKLVIPCHPA